MLGKLLLTLVVVLVAVAVLRTRAQARAPLVRVLRSTAPIKPRIPRLRRIAYAVATALMLTAGWIYYLHWREGREEVTVRVINTRTGEAVDYRARRGWLQGHRFETLDGRTVTIAHIERIEVLAPD